MVRHQGNFQDETKTEQFKHVKLKNETSAGTRNPAKRNMLVARRHGQVVEEEVTEVITNNNNGTGRELMRYEKNRLETFPFMAV